MTSLVTSASGRVVTGVETDVRGEHRVFEGDIVVVACGAINSAALLLRSANDAHPNGLANTSDQVGRNFMKHQNGAVVGLSKKPNPTVFQKTIAVNDFYHGAPGFHHPVGHVQRLGKVGSDMMGMDAPTGTPKRILNRMASHSVDWWLTSEDLPAAENRVVVSNQGIELRYQNGSAAAFDKLMSTWVDVLKQIDCGDEILHLSFYFKKRLPLEAVAHQVGTCRFGEDPSESVLDINCKAHDLDNLYVVDRSFFRSSAAVNPSLTIIANALRVGDHLLQRMS